MDKIAICIERVRVAAISADQRIEANAVADEDIVSTTAYIAGCVSNDGVECVTTATADQPVVAGITNQTVIEFRTDYAFVFIEQLVERVECHTAIGTGQTLIAKVCRRVQNDADIAECCHVETGAAKHFVGVTDLCCLTDAAHDDVVAAFAQKHVGA